MDLVTAVLSGNRDLEIRIFSTKIIVVKDEQVLTRGLCRLMDRHSTIWRR